MGALMARGEERVDRRSDKRLLPIYFNRINRSDCFRGLRSSVKKRGFEVVARHPALRPLPTVSSHRLSDSQSTRRGIACHVLCELFWKIGAASVSRENHPRPLLRKEGSLNLRRHHVAPYASQFVRTSPLLTMEGPVVVLTPKQNPLSQRKKSHINWLTRPLRVNCE